MAIKYLLDRRYETKQAHTQEDLLTFISFINSLKPKTEQELDRCFQTRIPFHLMMFFYFCFSFVDFKFSFRILSEILCFE